MKTIKWMMGLLAYIVFSVMAMAAPSLAADEQGIEVGRIYHIEGELLRYVPDENDWVAVVKDAPFGAEDTFFSGTNGMAEMIAPNGSWIRTGNNTQVQFIALAPDLAEMDVASGMARFYNKGSSTVIKATSPFGYVLAEPGAVFDFYVGENSVEVVAIKATVSFVHSAGDARYDVVAGSTSILADQNKVTSGDGTVDLYWDRWNGNRDSVWAAKLKHQGPSAEYLPPDLMYDADCLDEYGRWEFVIYDGAKRWFWRPTNIYVGWSPFTMGVWTEWCGDQTWIPAEPFGYVTHHYGNWVYMGNFWYWAPPVVSVRVGFPLLDIGFFWYPGRVAWIHRGVYVGWVPLAPRETYYSHHHWGGPHHAVVVNQTINQVNINVRNYNYADRAVIVNQNKFRGVENYRNARVVNVHPTIINEYHAAPVVNNTVINNYATNRQRYNYTNTTVQEKPHNTVINRIKQNETIIRQGRKEDAETLQKQVISIRNGKINRDERIEAPRAANYLVPVQEVNRPKSEIKLQQREIKNRAKAAYGENAGTDSKPEQQSSQSGKPAGQSEQPAPSKSSQQKKSVAQPKVVTPSIPSELKKPAVQPDRVVVPSKPGQQAQPSTQPEQAAPVKTNEKLKPAVQPDRVAVPAKINEPSNPASQAGGVVTPSIPTEKGVYKSEKAEKTEPATQKGGPKGKAVQKQSEQTDDQSESGTAGSPKQ
jgi:hypothetical protein